MNMAAPAVLNLPELIQQLQRYSGLQHKCDIAELAPALPPLPQGWHANGDDTAAIPDGNGYSLLAMEGLPNDFVNAQPWFAGWCSIMVNCSDIAAMGGKPIAVVNAVWDQPLNSTNGEHNARQVLLGMQDAATKLGVPIVGGHTNLHSEQTQLAVSILGRARHLLSAFAAQPGQVLVAAVDLRGAFEVQSLNWNAATRTPPGRLIKDLALLPDIAEQQLAIACKDISQAGLLGTAAMLAESSQVGLHINLAHIPKPATADWQSWLCAFPSFGYLLTTTPDKAQALVSRFQQRDITAAVIGQVTGGDRVQVSYGNQTALYRDLRTNPLTGLTAVQTRQPPYTTNTTTPFSGG